MICRDQQSPEVNAIICAAAALAGSFSRDVLSGMQNDDAVRDEALLVKALDAAGVSIPKADIDSIKDLRRMSCQHCDLVVLDGMQAQAILYGRTSFPQCTKACVPQGVIQANKAVSP